eukprot:TRINITY_DN1674_c0_g1_i2.p1 TRINITY_DN1674_c0_g1~~TRINITY_DN1674_c0_g1_i2.p1  ORF type:complete len:455 (-),score=85.23 TRINITY_DN1674_c0_g1_i2:34-1398(-)
MAHQDKSDSVFVQFFTRLAKQYVITDDRISVPASLKRMGLSGVVNHMLGTTDSPTPFDFLINGTFLRTSLKKFIAQHSLDDEGTLRLEYVFALGAAQGDNSFEHDDWVSAIDRHHTVSSQGLLISGCYDNIIRFWKYRKSGKGGHQNSDTTTATDGLCEGGPEDCVLRLEGHKGPINTLVSSMVGTKRGEATLVSGSQDQTLKVWKISLQTLTGQNTVTLVGHTASVQDCDLHKNGQLVVSCSWDSSVKLWNLNSTGDDNYLAVESAGEKSKRRKVTPGSSGNDASQMKKASLTMVGHKQAVSGLEWLDENSVVSASWDHSIRIWDVESGRSTTTLNGNSAIYGLSVLQSGLFVTAHADRTVRMWDQRQEGKEVYTVLSSHKGWASSVQGNPKNENLFISGSYDNTTKLWDKRSTTPLTTLHSHVDKVLAVGWCSEKEFASGGADNTLKTYRLK